jgi:hypothetical protein
METALSGSAALASDEYTDVDADISSILVQLEIMQVPT